MNAPLVKAPDEEKPPGKPPTGKQKRLPKGRQDKAAGREVILLLLPALIPVALLSVWPLLQGIYLGFTDSKAGLNQIVKFTGFENYSKLLGNELFWNSFKIGLIWTVAVTSLQFLLGLGLALLLNMNLKGRTLTRLLALIPWAMPPVIISIMWRLLYDPKSGPVNGMLQSVGIIDRDINWLGDFATALPAVILVGIWVGMPQTTISLLAGLQTVDNSLHEAAQVDGAGIWTRFWNITWPALLPVIVAITSLNFIWNFNSFGLVYVLTQGGPGGETMLPMLFAYNEAFRYGNFGYAAAMGNVMVIAIVLLMVVFLRTQMRRDK